MFTVFLNNVVLQLFYFVVMVYAVGFIISLLNRFFYNITGGGQALCYATGVIGTPIHELSHAAMCLVFFHRIDEIKLFQIDDENGVLGYVRHSYNKRNIWQVLGNYFIGTAPIMVGAAFVYLMSKFALPTTFGVITTNVESLISLQGKSFSIDNLAYIFPVLRNIFKSFINELTTEPTAWLFLVFALCIALHMNLSGADIKGSLGSIPWLALIFIILNAVFCFILKAYYKQFIYAITTVSSYIICMLCLSLVLSALCVLAGAAVKGGAAAIKALPRFKR